MLMGLAPVIIFNYNRPDHSIQTWNELSKNQFAKETELYLYCDGAKDDASDEMRNRIVSLHNIAKDYAITAKNKGLFKAVHVVLSNENKGLANSIIEGVSEVIEKHGRVIVLEDDLLTSQYFLKYMNEALNKYQDRPGVMSISANRPPVNKMAIPEEYPYDVFVSLRPFSTGWATWIDRWRRMDWTLDYLPAMLNDPIWIESFNRGGDDLTDMLCLQRDKKIDSWAIRWTYSHFKEHGVGILPCVPYVDNIGFDGTGTHSGNNESDYRNNVMLAPENPKFVDTIYEDKRIINAFANYYCRVRRPLWQKACNWFARRVGQPVPFIIKKKIYL